jgi:hypothetical protein
LDIAFDSYQREFKLGKKRILVPDSAIQTVIDPITGQMHRYFGFKIQRRNSTADAWEDVLYMDTNGNLQMKVI